MSKSTVKVKEIDFELPVHGIFLGSPYHQIPKGYSYDMLNVLAQDSLERVRIGQRPGLSKFFGSAQFGGGAKFCQHLSQINLTTTGSGVNGDYILTVFAGTAYLQKPGDTSVTALTGHTFSAARRVEACAFQDVIYFTDGLNMKKCTDLATLVDWTATAGSLPVAGGEYCRYLVEWRGRIVLSHLDKGNSGQIFFTAQNTPTDFDYGAVYTPTIAVSTTSNFKAGQMASAVTALIPINEDVLLISTSRSLNKMVGDPADGGQMVPISQEIGIINQDAWCLVGTTLYFVGTGGFYRMPSGGEPELLSSDAYNEIFKTLSEVNLFCECAYDHTRNIIWVTITHELTPWATSHFVWDIDRKGFFPIEFATTTGGDDEASGTTAPAIGPTKMCTFDGQYGTNIARTVLLGCRDGYVRQLDDTVRNDDVGQIPGAYVWLGPLQPGGATRESMLNGIYITSGEASNYGAIYGLVSGKDPRNAIDNYILNSFDRTLSVTTGSRNAPLGWRKAANSFFVFVEVNGTSKTFDLERVTGLFEPAGPVR